MMDVGGIPLCNQGGTGNWQKSFGPWAAQTAGFGLAGGGRVGGSDTWWLPLWILGVFVVGFLAPGSGWAQASEVGKDLPITITSDRMEGDLKAGVITFIDHVKVVRGDTILYADRVETYPKKGAEDVDRIVATGNVRVVRGSRLSMADRAEYLESGELLILSGHAKITEGNNTISGAIIRVYLDEDRTEVEGDTVERPRFLFFPEEGKRSRSVSPSD